MQRLKRTKAGFPISLQSHSGNVSEAARNVPSQAGELVSPKNYQRMLRILLRDPWEDYDYIRHVDQIVLASHKSSHFKLVNIRQYSTSNVIEQSRILSTIYHPNLAAIYDIYYDDDQAFLITEHLDISISELQLQRYELAEWEIATIIAEVLVIHHMKPSWLIVPGPQGSSLYLLSQAVMQRSLKRRH
jgi:hypothetical protein